MGIWMVGVLNPSEKHVPALDGLRGLAILLVILFHELPELAPGGAVGVDLFFALSSFLITGLLVGEVERSGSVDYAAFYWRRAIRLGPALLLFLLLVAPSVSLAIREPHIVSSSLATLLYVSDFARAGYWPTPMSEVYGHTWSLSVEEQFYLVWPLFCVLLMRRRGRWLSVAVIGLGVSAVLSVASRWLLGEGQTYFLPTGHLFSLAAGVLAFAFIHDGRPQWMDTLLSGRWATIASLAAVTAYATEIGRVPSEWLLPAGWLVSGCFIILIQASALPSGVGGAFLCSRPMQWLGQRSYGLYLYGLPLYLLFHSGEVGLSRRVGIVLSIVTSLVLAEMSFRYMERPIRSHGRQWLASRRGGTI